MANVKFMWNGIKIDGRLHRGYMCISADRDGVEHVTWYAKDYEGWEDAEQLRSIFEVENNSDIMTDYFETDKIRFFEGDEWFDEAMMAGRKKQLHDAKRHYNHLEKRGMYDRRPDLFDRCADLARIEELEAITA